MVKIIIFSYDFILSQNFVFVKRAVVINEVKPDGA